MEGFESSQPASDDGSRDGHRSLQNGWHAEPAGDDWQNGQTPSYLQEAHDDSSSQDMVGIDETGTGRERPILSPASARQLQRQLGMEGNNDNNNNRPIVPSPPPPPSDSVVQNQYNHHQHLVVQPRDGPQAEKENQGTMIVDVGQRTREPCCMPLSKTYSFYHCIEYHEPEPNKEGFFLLINKDRKASPLKLFRSQMVDLVVSLPAGLAQLEKFREYRSNPPDVETQHLVKLISRYTGTGIDKASNKKVETSFEVRLTASTGSVHIRGPSLWVRRYYFDKNFQEYLPTYAGVKFVEGDNIGELMRFVKECGQADRYF